MEFGCLPPRHVSNVIDDRNHCLLVLMMSGFALEFCDEDSPAGRADWEECSDTSVGSLRSGYECGVCGKTKISASMRKKGTQAAYEWAFVLASVPVPLVKGHI